MCRVHSWSWYDVYLWPQGQICRVMTWLCVLVTAFLSSGIVIPCLACGTMCLVNSWSLHDLELWPICGWRGYSQWVFLTVLYLFQFSTPDRSCDALLWFIFFRNKTWKWHLIMSFNFNIFFAELSQGKRCWSWVRSLYQYMYYCICPLLPSFEENGTYCYPPFLRLVGL